MHTGYWRDVGTIGSFYEASTLTHQNPPFSFLIPDGRVFTRPRFLPPSKIIDAQLDHALMSEGCILTGAKIEHSVVGLRSIVGHGTVIRRSVLMGNDYYEWPKPGEDRTIGIGKNCLIENCILDKNVGIGITFKSPTAAAEKKKMEKIIISGMVS